jgi:hypothetical protein
MWKNCLGKEWDITLVSLEKLFFVNSSSLKHKDPTYCSESIITVE